MDATLFFTRDQTTANIMQPATFVSLLCFKKNLRSNHYTSGDKMKEAIQNLIRGNSENLMMLFYLFKMLY